MKNAFSHLISQADREVIENKYHRTDAPFNPKNRMAHHGYDYDEGTGLSDAEIIEGLKALSDSLKGKHHYEIKSKLFAYILANTRIDVNEHDYFVGMYTWDRVMSSK